MKSRLDIIKKLLSFGSNSRTGETDSTVREIELDLLAKQAENLLKRCEEGPSRTYLKAYMDLWNLYQMEKGMRVQEQEGWFHKEDKKG